METELVFQRIREFIQHKSCVVTNSQVSCLLMDMPEFEAEKIQSGVVTTGDNPYNIGKIGGVTVMVDPKMKWSENVIYSKARLDKIAAGFVVWGNEGVLDLRNLGIQFI